MKTRMLCPLAAIAMAFALAACEQDTYPQSEETPTIRQGGDLDTSNPPGAAVEEMESDNGIPPQRTDLRPAAGATAPPASGDGATAEERYAAAMAACRELEQPARTECEREAEALRQGID